MKTTKMVNFLRGLIIMGVAFAFLWSFDWFRTLTKSLLIGFICIAGLILIYFGYRGYQRWKS